jgi:hypothetical protein
MTDQEDGFSTDRTLTEWCDGRITLDVVMRRTGATTPADLFEIAKSEHVSPMNLAAVAKLVEEV